MLSLATRAPAGLTSAARRPARRLTIVAFRDEDESVGSALKRKGRGAQAKTAQTARKAGSQLQRGGKQLSQGVRDRSLEEPVAGNSTVYGLNAVVLAVAAASAAYNPGFAAQILFKPEFLASGASAGGGLMVPLLQILSLGLSAAAVTNYVQSGGAEVGALQATLHKRLNASLSTFSVAQLALLGLCLTPLSSSILSGYQGTSVLNVAGIGVLGLGVAIQLYVASVNYARVSPEGYSPVGDVKLWLKDTANTFRGIDGVFSAGYAAVTGALFAAGVGYLVAPGITLPAVLGSSASGGGGPDAIVLWQLIGAGVAAIVAPMAYSLKEAAAANALSDIRAKLLNVAIATAGVGHWLVLQPRLGDPATSGPLLPVVLATWGTAALLGGVNLLQGRERDSA